MSEENVDVLLTKLTLSSFVLFQNLTFPIVKSLLLSLISMPLSTDSLHSIIAQLKFSYFSNLPLAFLILHRQHFLSFSLLFNPFTVFPQSHFPLWPIPAVSNKHTLSMPILLYFSNSFDRIGCMENREIYLKFSLPLRIIYLGFTTWNHIAMSYRLCTAFNCKKTAVCG